MTESTVPHPVLEQYYQRDGFRQSFVTALFDGAARHYDRVCGVMSLGSGTWYRRNALERSGLRPGMKLLDVATGTGLVARSAVRILAEPGAVVGLDPSAGMLQEARKTLCGPLVRGRVEDLPFGDASFDLLSIGYALRHVTSLEAAFAECRRVLKPGGRLLILEISRAPSPAMQAAIRVYLTRVLPLFMRLATRNAHARMLTRYYWDTIVTCVPPDVIVEVLQRSGFVDVERRVFAGFLTEYVATRPGRR